MMPETRGESVPESFLTDQPRIPYWDKFGGGAVTLVGDDIIGDTKNAYWKAMCEQGFYITNIIPDRRTLERMLPHLYVGELGAVAVIAALPTITRWRGGDSWARRVPEILEAGGHGDARVVLAFDRPLTVGQRDWAAESGFDVVAPYYPSRDAMIRVAARAVSLANAFTKRLR